MDRNLLFDNATRRWRRVVDVNTDPIILGYNHTDALERELVRKAEEQLRKEAEIRMRVWNSHSIKKVIFNDPATIVFWYDGTKTVVKCQPGDVYDKRMGLALCIAKKALGNKGNYNNVFDKWIPEELEQKSKYEVGDKVRCWTRNRSEVDTIVKDDGSDRMQYKESLNGTWYIEGLADE